MPNLILLLPALAFSAPAIDKLASEETASLAGVERLGQIAHPHRRRWWIHFFFSLRLRISSQ